MTSSLFLQKAGEENSNAKIDNIVLNYKYWTVSRLLFQKKKRRIAAVDSIAWGEEKRKRFRRAVVRYDVHSTDESGTDSDGRRVLGAQSRFWESEAFRTAKAALDRFEETTLASKRSLNQRLRRRPIAKQPSRAQKPDVDDRDVWMLA